MNNCLSIKSQVDSALLDRIEQECSQILYQQRLRHNERVVAFFLSTKIGKVLRPMGLIASLVGFVLGAFLVATSGVKTGQLSSGLTTVFFLVTAVFFYYLPRLEAWYFSRVRILGKKSCRRLARRVVKKGRKIVPYEVEYDIKGDLASFYRHNAGHWKLVGSGRLKGYAIVGKTITLVFRKPKSLFHKMLFIHESSEDLEGVFKDVKLSYTRVDGQATSQ
jgi:hypothetical protein